MGFVFNLHHLLPGESWTSFLKEMILYVLYKTSICILYIFSINQYIILYVCVYTCVCLQEADPRWN